MKKFFYPLIDNPFSSIDIIAGTKVLKTRQLTLSKITKNFEKSFAKKMRCKYSVMVNSGSSANLLALQCLINPYRKNSLKPGDEILIPALCWSTSLWPIVQSGLKPIFVDIDKNTLNIDEKLIASKITKKTKGIMLIHALGNSCDMNVLMKIKKKYNLILIEDTCESLGSKYSKKYLGTFGDFSTYSFYASHQISAGEGGMICCKNKEDYNIILSLRSHGWSRGTAFHDNIVKSNPSLDPRFIFFNSGYNLRPTEVSAAIGHSQFNRMDKLNNYRTINHNKIKSCLLSSKKLAGKVSFYEFQKKIKPSYFGIPIKIHSLNKNKFIKKLQKAGVETRPIISGNFSKQPSSLKYKLNSNKENFKNSEFVYDNSFFIGLPATPLKNSLIFKIRKAFEKSI